MAKVYNNQIRITYHTLHRVLSTLGFVRRKTPGFIAYREANHNALILLPLMSDDTVVSDPHLMAVSNTIIGKRVATQQRLQSLLLNDLGIIIILTCFPVLEQKLSAPENRLLNLKDC